ncbi:probable addiction module antidote protein [Rhizobiales bacterium GAS191]|jgi:probable addiction module antidote protein|nr:probable addiction module antidote protein [Rhizobiales bacterium GAS113]SEC48706.1 probable addiction module antidote protein [Rhizobiales bacterium GAS191]SEC77764.1 probable addiction module antidote protein [Rhizobiales bacterium GAS188]
MTIELRPYDSAEFLKTEAEIAAYLEEVFQDGDPALIAHALGVAARAHGMSQLARDAGLKRESLYRSLSSDGNPELSTVVSVMKALGLRLAAKPIRAKRPSGRRPRAKAA